MTQEPDVLELVYWLQLIEDPVERFTKATRYGDEVRSSLLVELAALRRRAAYEARQRLMAQGMNATEATRELARQAECSPQTVGRMINELRQYGGTGEPA